MWLLEQFEPGDAFDPTRLRVSQHRGTDIGVVAVSNHVDGLAVVEQEPVDVALADREQQTGIGDDEGDLWWLGFRRCFRGDHNVQRYTWPIDVYQR